MPEHSIELPRDRDLLWGSEGLTERYTKETIAALCIRAEPEASAARAFSDALRELGLDREKDSLRIEEVRCLSIPTRGETEKKSLELRGKFGDDRRVVWARLDARGRLLGLGAESAKTAQSVEITVGGTASAPSRASVTMGCAWIDVSAHRSSHSHGVLKSPTAEQGALIVQPRAGGSDRTCPVCGFHIAAGEGQAVVLRSTEDGWLCVFSPRGDRLSTLLEQAGGAEVAGVFSSLLEPIVQELDKAGTDLELAIQLDREDAHLLELRLAMSGRWSLALKPFAVTVLRLEMGIRRCDVPFMGACWAPSGELEAELEWDKKTVGFRLTDRHGDPLVGSGWALTPLQPQVPIADVAELFGALPKEIRGALKDVNLRGLTIGVARDWSGITALRGAVQWEHVYEATISARCAVSIDLLDVELSAKNPFNSDTRYIQFAMQGQATFTVNGKAELLTVQGQADSEGEWSIRGRYTGALSLTDAINSLASTFTGGEKELFGALDVSLVNTSVGVGSKGFFFDTYIAVTRKDGAAFDFFGGELSFELGHANIGWHKQLSLSLSAGMSVRWKSGYSLEYARITVERQRGESVVRLSGRMLFPTASGQPVSLGLDGDFGVVNGRSGFGLKGVLRDAPLNPIIEALHGEPLPKGFPTFKVKELGASFDSRTSAIHLWGEVTADLIALGKDRQLWDASLSLSVMNEAHRGGADGLGTRFELSGRARVLNFADQTFLSESSAELHLTVDAAQVNFTATVEGVVIDLLAVAGEEGEAHLSALYLSYQSGDTPALSLGAEATNQATFALTVAKSKPDATGGAIPGGLSMVRGLALGWRADDVGGRVSLEVDVKGTAIQRALSSLEGIEVGWTRAGGLDFALLPGSAALADPQREESEEPEEPEEPAAPALTKTPELPSAEQPTRLNKTFDLGPLKVENITILPHLKVTDQRKRPGVKVAADLTLAVGTWASATVTQLGLDLTVDALPSPTGLSLESLPALEVELSLEGAAIAVNIPKVVRGGVAVQIKRDLSQKTIDVTGVGSITLLEKLRVATLLYGHWEHRVDSYQLTAGFAFLCVSGFAVPLAPLPVTLTGLAGGFGYSAIPKLPTHAAEVADNALVKLLRGKGEIQSSELNAQAKAFQESVVITPGAWCVMVGATFVIASMVDCAALVVVEGRPTGLEVALLGLADFRLGYDPATGECKLGWIQLALLARYSSASRSLMIVGTVTNQSWVVDKACKVTGSFAICAWMGGEHEGDFLVSVGGYSPLKAVPAHYPSLDRVGFKWKVNEDLTLAGESYLALDRVGIAVGMSSSLTYRTRRVSVDAKLTFDALVEWSPLYYEVRVHMGVQVEVRVGVTIRLGLNVDMQIWGPPFGAYLYVAIRFWPFNPSFTISVGGSYQAAQDLRGSAPIADLMDLAAGGAGQTTLRVTAGGEAAALAKSEPGTALDVKRAKQHHDLTLKSSIPLDHAEIRIESAIPLTKLTLDGKPQPLEQSGTALSLRAKAPLGELESLLAITVDGPWKRWLVSVAALSTPIEALWTAKAGERFATALTLQPEQPQSAGKHLKGVRLEPSVTTPEAQKLVIGVDPREIVPSAERGGPVRADRTALQDRLIALGFGLDGCASADFRPFEAPPLTLRTDPSRRVA